MSAWEGSAAQVAWGQNRLAEEARESQVNSMRVGSVEPKTMSLSDCVLQLSQRAERLKKQLEDKIAMENELKSIELMLNALKAPR